MPYDSLGLLISFDVLDVFGSSGGLFPIFFLYQILLNARQSIIHRLFFYHISSALMTDPFVWVGFVILEKSV